jgi:hypothetical protein
MLIFMIKPMINIKKIFFVLVVSVTILYPAKSFSSTVVPFPNFNGDARDVLEALGDQLENGTGIDVMKVDDTAYFKLCEIRRMFCGTAKAAVIAIAVFIIGFLLVIGKLKWITLITVMSGLILFTSAEIVAVSLVSLPPNMGVVYSCYCIDTILNAVGLDTWSNSAPNWLQF